MKEPRNALERHAADIDDAATTANLRVSTLFEKHEPPNSLGKSGRG